MQQVGHLARRDIPNAASRSIFVLLLEILLLVGLAEGQQASEYQVKAAYLYNFAKSAQWPSKFLPEGTAPFIIGVIGGDEEFIDALQKIVSGKTIGSHPIAVKHLGTENDRSLCHIIFFRSSDRGGVSAGIATLKDGNSLLVGEDPSFLRNGGMINLVVNQGKIQFEVAETALERSDIHFSAKFLSLARMPSGSSNQVADVPRQIMVRISPEYPDIARKMSLKGSVQVEAVVGRNGIVKEIRVIGGHPLLADALSRAVKQWKYEPSGKESTELVKYTFE